MAIPPDLSDFSKEEIKTALDEVRYPFEIAVFSSDNYHNFGAIVRISHNFLAKKIHMVDFDEFYKKASMGCHKWENIEKTSLARFLENNADRNIIAFECRPGLQSTDIRTFEYPKNPILFFGSEKFGVPDQVLQQAKAVVSIPVFGVHVDYNLAVAAGIAMYDFVNKITVNK